MNAVITNKQNNAYGQDIDHLQKTYRSKMQVLIKVLLSLLELLLRLFQIQVLAIREFKDLAL